MGYGTWANTGRAYYTTTSNVASKAHHYTEVFTERSIVDALDPKNITVRESRDSEENPESTAIILGLDVTGSMGSIAHEIAKSGLGKIMEGILDVKPVTDPHLLFSAIGDVEAHDSAPLQVSQFEADHRIIEQLNQIYVEGGGGGNNHESYHLPWYFASKYTSIDCFEKRGKKGYLFTMGDELPPNGLAETHLKSVFGKGQFSSQSMDELLKAAEEKYHVFHIIITQGHYARGREDRVVSAWREVLGARALPLDNYENLAETVIAAIRISEGETAEDVIASYQDEGVRKSLHKALGV